MILLTVNEVIILHEKLISKTGGLNGIRDVSMLESAVLSCFQTFDEEELYPEIVDKAARMAFGICKNHPFIDGNKRTAILSMITILYTNGIKILYSQQELIQLGLGIADGSINYENIVEWVKKHIIS
ncbi:MAG: type II toxin-antitoxin system death-on-curing family toxin [Clostridia bacterium]|nr:type II toxin-antitoxin system death-on-curing family toxin [Clostridia bacterium]